MDLSSDPSQLPMAAEEHPETPRRLGRLLSMSPSEASPSNRQLRAPSPDSVLPHDWSSSAPEQWLIQLRQAVKDAVYRFTIEIHRALKFFEDSGKTHYKNYQGLEHGMQELWASWRTFSQAKDIDQGVLKASPLYFDLGNLIKKMRTPIGIHGDKGKEMGEIRMAARRVQKDVDEILSIIRIAFEEIAISAQENSSDALAEAFLPSVVGARCTGAGGEH